MNFREPGLRSFWECTRQHTVRYIISVYIETIDFQVWQLDRLFVRDILILKNKTDCMMTSLLLNSVLMKSNIRCKRRCSYIYFFSARVSRFDFFFIIVDKDLSILLPELSYVYLHCCSWVYFTVTLMIFLYDYLFDYSFHLIIYCFIYLYSFFDLFIHLLIHLFTYLFICLFVYQFSHVTLKIIC